MNIINFVNHFPDGESCEVYLKADREKVRIRCKTVNPTRSTIGIAAESFSSVALAEVGAP